MKLWEIATGRCLQTFEGHTHRVASVCFSEDGQFAISASDDKSLKMWYLDWDLIEQPTANWHKGARYYLKTFLTLHTPYAKTLPIEYYPTDTEIFLSLTRHGTPTWSEEDFQTLLRTLGCAGYGWLHPDGVRQQLEAMAKNWGNSRSSIRKVISGNISSTTTITNRQWMRSQFLNFVCIEIYWLSMPFSGTTHGCVVSLLANITLLVIVTLGGFHLLAASTASLAWFILFLYWYIQSQYRELRIFGHVNTYLIAENNLYNFLILNVLCPFLYLVALAFGFKGFDWLLLWFIVAVSMINGLILRGKRC